MAYRINIRQFKEKILEYEQYPIERHHILLYGSSFFANWGYARAHEQLCAASNGRLNVINHGFGGASVDELLYYYNRLVTPYAPGVAVLRCGINDIFQGLSPDTAAYLTELLVNWFRTDFADIKIVVLGVFDCKRVECEQYARMCEYNRLAQDFAAKYDNVYYADISEFFHDAPQYAGTHAHFRDVFVEDGLHLTDAAYAELAAYLAGRLALIGI